MLRPILPLALLVATFVSSCSQTAAPVNSAPHVSSDTRPTPTPMNPTPDSPSDSTALPTDGIEIATFGAGCFWCVEAVLEQYDGVLDVTSGYMGGALANPTYEQICTGATGHAEVVQVRFDPARITFADLLELFWQLHDPTTLNRQGADRGTQYRSAIFFHSEAQRELATQAKAAAATDFADPIVTEITAASTFYPAEEYHQGYYFANKERNPYCRAVITPKLKKLGLKH
jgi:peptide-methionine (S)-S-oxide reductase